MDLSKDNQGLINVTSAPAHPAYGYRDLTKA